LLTAVDASTSRAASPRAGRRHVEPGVIRHTALDLLIFGELDGSTSPRLQVLRDRCVEAGFDAKLSDRIQDELWLKFVRLTSLSGMMAATRSPLGVIRDDEDLWTLLQAAIMERWRPARKVFSFAEHAVGHAAASGHARMRKSSMLEDLEHGRRLELPWLNARPCASARVGTPGAHPSFISTVPAVRRRKFHATPREPCG
jgi:2-dehydropantoate 2-reductase